MFKNQYLILILFLIQLIESKNIELYNPKFDSVELLNVSTFNNVIYNSSKASLVEFFAHWCGTCQRFAPHWRELSKDTKPWHDKVIRVAAIDCALSINNQICWGHNVQFYPTVKFFPPNAPANSSGTMLDAENPNIERFMDAMILYVEGLPNKPSNFPSLEPYR